MNLLLAQCGSCDSLGKSRGEVEMVGVPSSTSKDVKSPQGPGLPTEAISLPAKRTTLHAISHFNR